MKRDSVIRSLCFACREPGQLTPAARRYVDFMFEYFDIPKDKLDIAVFDR